MIVYLLNEIEHCCVPNCVTYTDTDVVNIPALRLGTTHCQSPKVPIMLPNSMPKRGHIRLAYESRDSSGALSLLDYGRAGSALICKDPEIF